MQAVMLVFIALILSLSDAHNTAEAQIPPLWKGLKSGPHQVGFRLVEARDPTRSYYSNSGELEPRSIRIYIWYPAEKTASLPLELGDYVKMAADDFEPNRDDRIESYEEMPLPVPLAKGLDRERLDMLLESETVAVIDAAPVDGSFPLLVFGQGLYYESPLNHVVLCEFLAANGYVVATCPLKGAFTRLVNLSATDLEAQIRDMEFVLSRTRSLPYVDSDRVGVIGYDLGGMSGLVLAMRNPEVDAFLSIDAGILYGHFSELPLSHPHYNEDRFLIPWMHLTQARFVQPVGSNRPSLMSRKRYSDTYLVLVDTDNHGAFTSYAAFGIEKPVPGYWGAVSNDSTMISTALCSQSLIFFNAYLNGGDDAMDLMQKDPEDPGLSKAFIEIRRKKGESRPPYGDMLVSSIIEQGIDKAIPEIMEARNRFPERIIIRESMLNWLGYHFLYWWGREAEAVKVFELIVDLYPTSANAYDSLGEAYRQIGNRDEAIKSYEKSLELNPNNENAKLVLKQIRM